MMSTSGPILGGMIGAIKTLSANPKEVENKTDKKDVRLKQVLENVQEAAVIGAACGAASSIFDGVVQFSGDTNPQLNPNDTGKKLDIKQ